MKKIIVVTGTRAEYGLLKNVMKRIDEDEELDLCLIVTGTHLEEKFGNTYRFIEEDGFQIDYRIPMNLTGNTTRSVVKSMAMELAAFSEVMETVEADMMVLLGDRYEILIAAITAMMYKVPIAHIHGGEITEGAVDDSIRHSITKMSYLHFASTKEYADRICQMGENPAYVFSVGALGVENIRETKLLTREELVIKYGGIFENPYVMVTYHPVTIGEDDAEKQFKDILAVIRRHSEYNYCFTYANADMGGAVINALVDEFVKENKNACAFASMGQNGYLSALRYCNFIVGNSSSGILEAPSFGIATINIGERQKGRIRAASVIDCSCSQEKIEGAFQRAASEAFQRICRSVDNPYAAKDTSERIVMEIKKYLVSGKYLKKRFFDMKVEER